MIIHISIIRHDDLPFVKMTLAFGGAVLEKREAKQSQADSHGIGFGRLGAGRRGKSTGEGAFGERESQLIVGGQERTVERRKWGAYWSETIDTGTGDGTEQTDGLAVVEHLAFGGAAGDWQNKRDGFAVGAVPFGEVGVEEILQEIESDGIGGGGGGADQGDGGEEADIDVVCAGKSVEVAAGDVVDIGADGNVKIEATDGVATWGNGGGSQAGD